MSRHENPYGVGLAYRYVIHEGVFQYRDSIDLLELPTEDYLVRGRKILSDPQEQLLSEVLHEIPCVAHGISLSLGSVEPLDDRYVEGTRQFLEQHGMAVFSEHLAFHRIQGNDLTIFLPMPFEEESVEWVARNYREVRARLGRPFALENVTYHFPIPDGGLSEAEFFTRITEETDASLLLDVTNVFNNAHNHGYDPIAFLDAMPLDRVSQLHLAGGHFVDNKWEDSHSRPVMPPVWDLYEEVIQRTSAGIVIIERDSRFHPFETVLEDVERAREIFYRHRPEKRPEGTSGIQVDPSGRGQEPKPVPEERVENVRGFQRALMERITNPDFRREYQRDPRGALDRFALPEAWKKKVQQCPEAAVKRLEESWDALSRQAKRDEQETEEAEWAEWARILEAETSR